MDTYKKALSHIETMRKTYPLFGSKNKTAKAVGVSQSVFIRFTNGRTKLTHYIYCKIAEYYKSNMPCVECPDIPNTDQLRTALIGIGTKQLAKLGKEIGLCNGYYLNHVKSGEVCLHLESACRLTDALKKEGLL